MQLEDLYFAPEDLYRLGNSSGPRLTNVRRPKDVDTTEINGITVVIANGKGISLSTKRHIPLHKGKARQYSTVWLGLENRQRGNRSHRVKTPERPPWTLQHLPRVKHAA